LNLRPGVDNVFFTFRILYGRDLQRINGLSLDRVTYCRGEVVDLDAVLELQRWKLSLGLLKSREKMAFNC